MKNPTDRMRDLLRNRSQEMLHVTARDDLDLLGRQFGKLSTEQMLRLFSLTNCVRKTLKHAILFLCHRGHEHSWTNIRCEIDRVQVRPGAREERVMSVMLLAWLAAMSKSDPFTITDEIHDNDHPFMEQYVSSEGLDLSKLLSDGVFWVNSAKSWGVQLADIAAHIVYRAAMDGNDNRGSATLFASLMRSSYYGHHQGPGLLLLPNAGASSAIESKYSLLYEVLKETL